MVWQDQVKVKLSLLAYSLGTTSLTIIHNSYYTAAASYPLKPHPLNIQVSPTIIDVELACIQLRAKYNGVI